MSEVAWGYERHATVQVLQAGVRKAAVVNGHFVAVEVNQSSAAVARRRDLVVGLHGTHCIAPPEVLLWSVL